MRPENQEGRPGQEAPLTSAAAASSDSAMLPRDGGRERQRRHARAAEAAMPLTEFYRRWAGLPELPAGPAVCPPWYPLCPGRRSA